MSPSRHAPAGRTTTLTITAAAALALVAIGCSARDDAGGDRENAATTPRALSITISGPATGPKLTMPSTVRAGLTRIRVTSTTTRKLVAVQLVRFDAGHTAAEALAGAEEWARLTGPLPAWVHLTGGVVSLLGKRTAVATQILTPGRYVAFAVDTVLATRADSPGEPAARFRVTAGARGGGVLPSPAARITMTEYGFATSGLVAGRQSVRVANIGKESHFVVGYPLKPGKTKADARRYFAPRVGEPKTPAPVDFNRAFNSALLDGGLRQVVDLTLDKGTYVLLCTVPDRIGGTVHMAKGMLHTVKVQ